MKKHRILFYYREDTKGAKEWTKKIKSRILSKYKESTFIEAGDKTKPTAVIVLGGDGTIIEAIGKHQHSHPLFLCLNLGHVGFLASEREHENFLKSVDKFFDGQYFISKRIMARVDLIRNKKTIVSGSIINDVVIQNLVGVGEYTISIDDIEVQHIRGGGVLVSTATGSTAYNLSANGPLIMPEIKCFVVTELFDHNTPTPSIVVKRNRNISISIDSFRSKGTVMLAENKEPIDVALIIDGVVTTALKEGDVVRVKQSKKLVQLVSFDKEYFFKSLREKFSFY